MQKQEMKPSTKKICTSKGDREKTLTLTQGRPDRTQIVEGMMEANAIKEAKAEDKGTGTSHTRPQRPGAGTKEENHVVGRTETTPGTPKGETIDTAPRSMRTRRENGPKVGTGAKANQDPQTSQGDNCRYHKT
ncbi:hypothetical protein PCASD_01184 [Puccinia coronata f. sp. avenae]|uniref:Uncharacterized protein n=1 Tax=Puccinia coronata f. sp. avenae TaxID=200324 RepID=A0A2N5VLT6_9BASI|nr:hypothetical protein PCASD_25036 [Puccinia coronata f. sp. avenae]PLW50948.1 hypothetical protein PCASD_01184 [Puccinia coronata f. sp. avenae]